MKKIIIVVLFIYISTLIFSEVIILNDGKKIFGKMIKMDEDTITLLTEKEEMIFDRDEIKAIYMTEEDYNESIKKVENVSVEKEEPKTDNLLKNGDFSNNYDGWLLPETKGIFRIENETAVIDIEKTFEGSHVDFYHKDLKLDKGSIYTVKFRARSTIHLNTNVSVQQMSGDWKQYSQRGFRLTKNMKEYNFTFLMTGETDGYSRLLFVFECKKCKIYIDDVAIIKKK